MLKNEHVKMSWDFECNIRTESAARRPDHTIEYKERKVLHLVDMACPSEKNVLETNKEKRQKYQQLAEVGKRRPGYRVEAITVAIGCMSGGVEMMKEQVRQILHQQ